MAKQRVAVIRTIDCGGRGDSVVMELHGSVEELVMLGVVLVI